MIRGHAILAALLLAGVQPAGAERFVLAWPPSFYDTAELAVHRGPESGSSPERVRVTARGLSVDEELPLDSALRVALPVAARCAVGLDDCAIVVESDASDLRVVLQSPDTRGVPDTLARTAHDTVRAPARSEAGARFVLLSAPNGGDHPDGLSLASIAAVEGAVTVTVEAPCLGTVGESIEPGSVLTVGCEGVAEDLTGARVTSDGPVTVLSGNRSTALPVEEGSGWSADLVLDAPLALAPLDGGATWLVPPLPRRDTHVGLGDLLRCAAGDALSVRIRDERGLDETRALATGELLELDTADAGGESVLRLDADGPLVCWQLSKSRAHRGTGDPAAVPLVPRELFTTADRAWAPDGYAEGTHLVVVAEAGTAIRLDGAPLGGFAPAPGGDLAWAVVELPSPPSGEGSLLALEGDGGFGAWLFGQGGYKAHGLTVARARPSAPATPIRRGALPDGLEVVDETSATSWCEQEASSLAFYDVLADATLRLRREGDETCLDWGSGGG